MTGDLVNWLRELGEHPCRSELPMGVGLRQAAIVLEALEAENERLRQQLSAIGPHLKVDPSAIYPQSGSASARAALGEKQ